MRGRISGRGAVLALTLLAIACNETTGPDPRALGILQLDPGTVPSSFTPQPDEAITWSVGPGDAFVYPPAVIEAPDTVEAGEEFEIVVRTVGPDGCWSADGQTTEVGSGVIEVQPFDRHSGADLCTQALGYLPHVVRLHLDEPGIWTIRARGRRVRSEPDSEEPVTAERRLIVR